ncbi:hypothetical protein D0Y65_028778 [Glycine soja]|uniref:QLQ domain-containing protein n=1 Tax=Glycine soja TaxID=3848 RepID=A0A445HW52_GLYSO|nr:hypothetical protein D0Y65_028778 [Glycine soja]
MSVPPPLAAVMWMSFMVAQWPWLEHQALIFKYLKAGLSVPLDLLLPIYKSLQLMSSHPSKLVEEVTNLDTTFGTYEESITQSTEREATTLKTTKTEEEQSETSASPRKNKSSTSHWFKGGPMRVGELMEEWGSDGRSEGRGKRKKEMDFLRKKK